MSDLSDLQYPDNDAINREKGGRPSDATNSSKQKRKQEVIAMKKQYYRRIEKRVFLVFQSKGTRVGNGRMKENIEKKLKNKKNYKILMYLK